MTVKWIRDAGTRRAAWIAAVIAALPQMFFPAFLPKGYPMVYPILLAVRIGYEEELLRAELSGYDAYLHKVRWRMIPFIW